MGRVLYLLYDRRVHPVQQAGEHRLARLPVDDEDRGDDEPHDGLGRRVAEGVLKRGGVLRCSPRKMCRPAYTSPV
jgi:hypothetical protein